MIEHSFWKDKKVLITGHTGFKGSWISLFLKRLGANLHGLSLAPENGSMFKNLELSKLYTDEHYVDIRNTEIKDIITDLSPEIIIHMAAQPLVREGYLNPVQTHDVNIMGTINLFTSSLNLPNLLGILVVTTDKCYQNNEVLRGYKETDSMGGIDPYSASKACVEIICTSYRESFFKDRGIKIASARSGNVIGGGDWSKDRIVPDAIRSFIQDKQLLLRNPNSIRPWQHVLDPLSGYLQVCQNFENSHFTSSAWNFGPKETDVLSVGNLVDLIFKSWGSDKKYYLDSSEQPHEAQLLTLDCTKANEILKWSPKWNFEKTVKETVTWYKKDYEKNDMLNFTYQQIDNFMDSA